MKGFLLKELNFKQIWRCCIIIFSTDIICTLLCIIFNPRQADSVHKYSFTMNGITVYLTGFERFVIYGLFILTGVVYWLLYRAFMKNMKDTRDKQNVRKGDT